VSRQVNELEEDLGARLFARTTRKLSLTEAGQLYYERVSNIINEVSAVFITIEQVLFRASPLVLTFKLTNADSVPGAYLFAAQSLHFDMLRIFPPSPAGGIFASGSGL
jgi:DNA-binding transcriptional LysR family regulator